MRLPRILGTCLAVIAALSCAPSIALATPADASIEVIQSRGTNALTEGDTGYTVSIALSATSSAPVVVTLGGPGLVATPSTLTFLPVTARVHQPVVITVVDDTIATAGETRTLTATSASTEPAFHGLTRGIELLVLDDDGVSLELDETGRDTAVVEGGAGDTVLVRLGTRPRQPVSVFLGGPGIDVVPDMVVVRPEQWDLGLSATVAARDDSIENGSRTTTLTARTVSPDALWSTRSASLTVSIEDDDRHAIREGGPELPPSIPVSRANRTPSVPTFTLAPAWREGGNVVLRFRSQDADGDPIRFRVLSRSHSPGERLPHDWHLATETTSNRFDAGPIGPFEQRCFRIEAVDPMGAAATTAVTCTHGPADAATVASNYGWKARPMRGASNGTISEPTKYRRLVYFTHTGVRAELTFVRCRTCASIRLVDPDGRNRIISLRGSGRQVVSVPLNATGRRIWGFYVHGPGTVLFDTVSVVGAS